MDGNGRTRVAFVGKGGSGKSAIAGTFARVLSRQGEQVLAIDVDHVPGLAFSLGVEVTDTLIPDEAVTEKPEGTRGLPYRLVPGLSAAEAIDRYAVAGPDGVRFLQFGKVDGGDIERYMRPLCAFHQILREVPATHWSLVGDLPAGTLLAFAGMADYARTLLVVVEPTAKGLLSARRLARLAASGNPPERVFAVANKVREPGDAALVEERSGLEVVAAVPWDEELADAERRGLAPIDGAPLSPGVRAVEQLVERIRGNRG